MQTVIELEYSHLHPGTGVSGERCPKCKGGKSGERSLSVSRDTDNVLKWMCHRASCGFRGTTGSPTIVNVNNPQPAAKPRERNVVKLPLPEDIKRELKERYLFTDGTIDHAGLGWSEDYSRNGAGRVYIPVRDRLRQEVGCVLRTPKGQSQENGTKSLTLTKYDDALAWYPRDGSNLIILVEDCYSGIRLWQEGISAIALLGTHLNDERVQEIKAGSRGTPVAIALDEDAYLKSIKFVLRYRNELRMRLIRLKKDIKDLSETEMQDFILRTLA